MPNVPETYVHRIGRTGRAESFGKSYSLCSEDEKTYVHRIGRTARAGAHGIAVTFVDWDELARWKMIDQTLELGLAEPPSSRPLMLYVADGSAFPSSSGVNPMISIMTMVHYTIKELIRGM